ncbi:hypothetical protein DFS34DRAFT_589549 [Phlyctochytrium arcticum]|nr:hypothetical protein DFS34DRAFT_589549 [Phlyctochytrium arcticum]
MVRSTILASVTLALAASTAFVSAQTTTATCAAAAPFDECIRNIQAQTNGCSDAACQCRVATGKVFCYINFCGGVSSTHPEYPAATCSRNQLCPSTSAPNAVGWNGSCNNLPNANGGVNGNNSTNGNGTTNNNNNGTSTQNSGAFSSVHVWTTAMTVVGMAASVAML